ncbi:MAG: 5'/3'-nucleotidase SurE [Planctomycetes bacterium]|nr:5'/3'-nucleotidase SurE [Planctomycetota bacterium]
MRILLTNDDGIHAPGLLALKNELSRTAEVDVVAPMAEQSAVGHSITLHRPLRVIEIERDGELVGYGVNGAPADCVKLALAELLDERPDVVVSGINLGANVGVNVLYSGTVAAAIEGAMFGIPSLAVSIEIEDRPQFDPAARIVGKLIRKMPLAELGDHVILNVNVPAIPPSRIKGVKVTRQSVRAPEEAFDRRTDPRGRYYYWITADFDGLAEEEGTDVNALRDGYVSITPLHFDMTRHTLLQKLGNWDLGGGLA